MKIFVDIKSVRKEIKNQRGQGKIISFVPTMGAIHEGHLSLIREARKKADIVVVSIFVNQKQFNNPEDYKNYPSTLDSDIKKLKEVTDILFTPKSRELYNDNFATNITLDKLANVLCGITRPGHFDGVALIVTKLFNIIKPDIAIFGQKDFQQLQIIKKLVFDLDIDVKIISSRTIREKDGLAMSSRNLRLNNKSRKVAPKIYELMLSIKKQLWQHFLKKDRLDMDDIKKILTLAKKTLQKSYPQFNKIDYLEIRKEEDLELIQKFNPKVKSRIFIAVYLDQIRLIDNLKLY